MGKVKEMKLPKYLRLAKGIMWMDTDGDNPSGITLYKTTEVMVGRGCKEHSKIKHDTNKNEDSTHGNYGYIDVTDSMIEKSYFCTDDIPQEKLSRVLTAMQAGILVPYTPGDPIPDLQGHGDMKKNFKIDRDGDLVFDGKNTEIYKKLMNTEFEKLKDFVNSCESSTNLIDMYHYELRGYNPLNRPRAEVLDIIQKKLNRYGPRMTPLRVNDIDEDEEPKKVKKESKRK